MDPEVTEEEFDASSSDKIKEEIISDCCVVVSNIPALTLDEYIQDFFSSRLIFPILIFFLITYCPSVLTDNLKS